MKVARELKQPELITIADTIPDITDEEALRVVMTHIADFARMQVKQREDQLLAGTTLMAGASGGGLPASPASDDAWHNRIESLALGSRDRSKALEEYGKWLEQTHRR